MRLAQCKTRRRIIGRTLRQRRERFGLSRNQLAKALRKSVATISKIEGGTQAMDVTLLGEFAAALGLNSSKLLLQSLEKTAKTDFQIELNRIYRKVVYGKGNPRRRTKKPNRRAA